MSFAERIKEGIENKDWTKIIEGYRILTGRDLSVGSSSSASSSADTKKESDFLAEIRNEKNIRTDESEDFSGKVARKEPMNLEREAGWIDDRTIATGEFVSKNPSLGVAQPVERGKRNTGNRVEVECMVCHKKEEVSPVLVSNPQTYKCNDCIPSGR